MKTCAAPLALALGLAFATPASAANITFTIDGDWLNASFTFAESDLVDTSNAFITEYEVRMTDPVYITYPSFDLSWSGNLTDRVEFIRFGEDGFIDMVTEWNQITFDYGDSFLKDGYFTLGEHSIVYYVQPTPAVHLLTITADGPIRQAPVVTDPGAVPEPATWAMMLGGFALVGSAVRRRRGANALAC